VTLEVLRVICN